MPKIKNSTKKLFKKKHKKVDKSRQQIYLYRKDIWNPFLKTTTDTLFLHNAKGQIIKIYIHDDRVKNMKSLGEHRANEKAIRYFYQKHSNRKELYLPITPEKLKTMVSKFEDIHKGKDYVKDIKEYRTVQNRLIFTNQKRISDFDFMYIRVKIRINFDGVYIYSYGRSNYFYKELTPELAKKGYRLHKKGILPTEEKAALSKAIIEALRPYGYDLEYKLVSWNYVYHQRPKDYI